MRSQIVQFDSPIPGARTGDEFDNAKTSLDDLGKNFFLKEALMNTTSVPLIWSSYLRAYATVPFSEPGTDIKYG